MKANKFYIYFRGQKLSFKAYIEVLKKLNKNELEVEMDTQRWQDIFSSTKKLQTFFNEVLWPLLNVPVFEIKILEKNDKTN